MLDLINLKLLLSLVILLVTIAAAWFPFKQRWQTKAAVSYPTGEALACGVFLGAGLLHMLAESHTVFLRLGYHYPWPFFLACLVFLFLLWLEHIGTEYSHHHGTSNLNFAIIATSMLAIHSLLEGAAVGISDNLSITLILFTAILAHKWAASFALAAQINRASDVSTRSGVLMFSLFAIMTPIGIIGGSYVTTTISYSPLIEPVLEALAAGTFIYLGTLHGLNRAVMISRCCDLKHYSFVILGFSIMALVAYVH